MTLPSSKPSFHCVAYTWKDMIADIHVERERREDRRDARSKGRHRQRFSTA